MRFTVFTKECMFFSYAPCIAGQLSWCLRNYGVFGLSSPSCVLKSKSIRSGARCCGKSVRLCTRTPVIASAIQRIPGRCPSSPASRKSSL